MFQLTALPFRPPSLGGFFLVLKNLAQVPLSFPGVQTKSADPRVSRYAVLLILLNALNYMGKPRTSCLTPHPSMMPPKGSTTASKSCSKSPMPS